MHADLPRNLGFGPSAFQERVNLAAFVIGQVTIAFGHVSSGEMWKSHARIIFTWLPAYTAWLRVVDKAGGLKGARCARIASGDKPLTPPFIHRSLRHAVYASLLHFGVETARTFARPGK